MREEKKYEILPGVETPAMSKIQEAASDFSISEVGSLSLNSVAFYPTKESEGSSNAAPDIASLQKLGEHFEEDQEKSQAESRAVMNKIMRNVQSPKSIKELKESHIADLDEKKRKELEDQARAREILKAKEDEKNRIREERRQLQKKMVEESKERALQEREMLNKEAEVAAEASEVVKTQEETKPVEIVEPVAKTEPTKSFAFEISGFWAEILSKEKIELKDTDKGLIAKFNENKETAKTDSDEKTPEQESSSSFVHQKKITRQLSADETFNDFKEFLGE